MEQTLFLKGVALFATMVGLQQWLAQGVSLYDVAFIGLATMFLATLEMDYTKYKQRIETRKSGRENISGAGENGAITPSGAKSQKAGFGLTVA
ncbi:MAG: hypothetical protein WC308_03635 [archaeon]|jgi:hypothetical protein